MNKQKPKSLFLCGGVFFGILLLSAAGLSATRPGREWVLCQALARHQVGLVHWCIEHGARPNCHCMGETNSILVAMGLAPACPAASTHQKRKEFIGHADPKGYRCRFTLSSDWQGEDDRNFRSGPIDGQIDEATLFPKNWTRRSTSNPPEIYLQTFGKSLLPGDVPIIHGYPEPVGWGKDRLSTHRHLRIDGCPATMVRADWVERGRRYRETEFYVYEPSRSILYLLHTLPDSAEYDRMDCEMLAIIRTFHVEQIAPTTRRKR